MQVAEQKLGDLTGSRMVDVFRNMAESDPLAVWVEEELVSSARATIYRLHKQTNYRFRTSSTPTDMLVWRLADRKEGAK